MKIEMQWIRGNPYHSFGGGPRDPRTGFDFTVLPLHLIGVKESKAFKIRTVRNSNSGVVIARFNPSAFLSQTQRRKLVASLSLFP